MSEATKKFMQSSLFTTVAMFTYVAKIAAIKYILGLTMTAIKNGNRGCRFLFITSLTKQG